MKRSSPAVQTESPITDADADEDKLNLYVIKILSPPDKALPKQSSLESWRVTTER